jgi:hypothetical protein
MKNCRGTEPYAQPSVLLPKRNVVFDLLLHGKSRALVLRDSRSFAWFLHSGIELETVNTAFTVGRIIFWTCHLYILPIRSFSPGPKLLVVRFGLLSKNFLLAHIKLFRLLAF